MFVISFLTKKRTKDGFFGRISSEPVATRNNRIHHSRILKYLSIPNTWEEVEDGLRRFYSKYMPDGRIIPRLEQIRTPKRTVNEEVEFMAKMGANFVL